MQQIEMRIKGGKVKIDAIGFTGTACEAATRVAEQALGGQIVEREYKPEYYVTTEGEQRVTGG